MSGASIIWGANGSSSSGGGSWEFRLSGLLPAANAPAALHEALAAAAGAGTNGSSSNGSRLKCKSGLQDLDSNSPKHQMQQQQQPYGGACYSLSCRLAISDGLDEAQPFYIGVPSWLALSEDNTWGRNFFFAQLELQRSDGALQQLNPAAVAADCSASQQQQQPLRVQRPFEGDSVEQLMTVTAEMFTQLKLGGAAAGCEAALSSSSNGSSSCVAPVWLPRGIARLSTDSSSSICSMDPSVVSTAALSTPTASSVTNSSSGQTHQQQQQQQQMGSAGSVRSTSSSAAASSVTASGVVGSWVCRGLPVPGLVMGPLVGRGSYGRVYRGLLRGQPVAVKVSSWSAAELVYANCCSLACCCCCGCC
jgi:hypothetical protein